MTTFDDRDKAFENKFAHDEETAFRISARRNKLLGQWAAEKLGKKGADAEAYAREVVMSDFKGSGDEDVLEKMLADFRQSKLSLTAENIRTEMQRLLPIAREQIIGEK